MRAQGKLLQKREVIKPLYGSAKKLHKSWVKLNQQWFLWRQEYGKYENFPTVDRRIHFSLGPPVAYDMTFRAAITLTSIVLRNRPELILTRP